MVLITFFLISLILQDKNITTQELVFKTKDNVTIYGTFYESNLGKSNLPAILLLHQFRSNRSEWNAYAIELSAQGYIVLSIDLRGHGQSDSIRNDIEMLNAPDQSPLEVYEAIQKLKTHPKVDPKRIAVMGGSVGGNLSAVAAGSGWSKLAVCISGKTSAVQNLAANQQNFTFKNTMYVAASNDGQREFYANEMGKDSQGENEILIDSKSSAHGVSMLKNMTIKNKIYDWLKAHL